MTYKVCLRCRKWLRDCECKKVESKKEEAMTPTARAMSYEAAKDVERCCIECYRTDCDCKPSDQFPVIPTVTMHNDGPHDSMNAPSEEVPFPQRPLNEKVAFVKQMKQEALARKAVKDVTPVEQVQAERGNAYGDPEYNLGGIAQAMTGYLENKWQMKLPSPITEHDVCVFNVQQKLSRMARTPGHADSLLDAHSYLDLAAKAVQRG